MRGLIILATVIALGSAELAQAAEPITKRQVRAGPSSVVNRQIMDQVTDLLQPGEDGSGAVPTRPLTDQVVRTRPRTGEVPGLCRVDQLMVEFEATGGAGKGADKPVRASGFTASSLYAVMREPDGPYDRVVRENPVALSRDPCSSFDFWEADFFQAASDREAIGAHRLYRQMLAELPKGELKPVCDLSQAFDSSLSCEAFLTTFRPDKVDVCLSDMPDLKGVWCRQFSTPGVDVRIFAVFPKGFGGDAQGIRRVDVSTSYVDLHPPID